MRQYLSESQSQRPEDEQGIRMQDRPKGIFFDKLSECSDQPIFFCPASTIFSPLCSCSRNLLSSAAADI